MAILKRMSASLAAGLLGITLLTGCAAEESQVDGVLDKFGMVDVDGRQLVDELEATAVQDRSTDFIASVRADHVLVIDMETEEEAKVDLPDDLFYLSIAPYQYQTHPCGFHSLTTCTAEFANTDFDVTVVDDAGEVILEETITTQDNGFFGLWLPAEIEGTITIEHENGSVTGDFSTHDDAKTCETDLRLT